MAFTCNNRWKKEDAARHQFHLHMHPPTLTTGFLLFTTKNKANKWVCLGLKVKYVTWVAHILSGIWEWNWTNDTDLLCTPCCSSSHWDRSQPSQQWPAPTPAHQTPTLAWSPPPEQEHSGDSRCRKPSSLGSICHISDRSLAVNNNPFEIVFSFFLTTWM